MCMKCVAVGGAMALALGLMGLGQAARADELGDKAKAIWLAQYKDRCYPIGGEMAQVEPERHALRFKYASEDADQDEQVHTLFAFSCFSGAYNFSSVYYLADEYDEIRALHFAKPAYDVTYVDAGNSDSAVKSIALTGFTAAEALTNPEYDPETMTLTEFAKWRGMGDASSRGAWTFHEGQFVLKAYAVDASYDGELNEIEIYSAQ